MPETAAAVLPAASTARVYADEVMAADLSINDKVTYHRRKGSGYTSDQMYIQYDFTTKKGYAQRKEDWASAGAGMLWHYPVSSGPYSKKNCRVLGQYVYISKKRFTHQSAYPGGSAISYTDITPLHVSHQYFERAPEVPPPSVQDSRRYEDLREQAYNIMPWYNVDNWFVFLQAATTSPNLYTDTHYVLRAELDLGGLDSTHPPYVNIAYEDIPPYVTKAFPSNQFADKTENIVLSWKFSYSNAFHSDFEGRKPDTSYTAHMSGRIRQKKAVVRWKQAGSAAVHEQTLTTEESFTIPKGQITADTFQWQVVVTSDDDVTDPSPVWYTVTTDNDSLSTAKAISPQKMTIDGGIPQEFVWEHHNESGTRCTRSELQYSTDSGSTWEPLAVVEGRETHCMIPVGTLPSGVLLWRVRTSNVSGVPGSWSDPVSLNCRGASRAPTVETVSSSPMPLIRWQGQGQAVAEIRIDGESGFVYGQQPEFQWRTVLQDGPHTVQVRIQNQYALWSKWGEASFETENFPQSGLILTGKPVPYGVRLSWNKSFAQTEIRRDGCYLGTLEGSSLFYTDWESAGPCSYEIRGITEDGFYTDSGRVTVSPKTDCSVIGTPEQWIPLEGRYGAPPEHIASVRRMVQFRYYAGRKEPVAYPSENWETVHRFHFSLRKGEGEKLHLLQALSGSHVVYKDSRGDLAAGILGTVSSANNGMYLDVRFEVVQSDERSLL